MSINDKYMPQNLKPKQGDVKQVIKFAWLPTWIDLNLEYELDLQENEHTYGLIWLTHYKAYFEYQLQKPIIPGTINNAPSFKWKLIHKGKI